MFENVLALFSRHAYNSISRKLKNSHNTCMMICYNIRHHHEHLPWSRQDIFSTYTYSNSIHTLTYHSTASTYFSSFSEQKHFCNNSQQPKEKKKIQTGQQLQWPMIYDVNNEQALLFFLILYNARGYVN